MHLFLVQHGEAKSEAEDPERPLTDNGAAEVERVAAWAASCGVAPARIRHSGKRRAEQTAAILADHLAPPEGSVAVSGLKPKDDVGPLAASLEDESASVMLVGHLPHLTRLAALLLTGNAEATVLDFRNAGVVCLRREAGKWSVAWALTPELLP